MQAKTFLFIRLLVAALLAMVVSVGITLGSYILPLIALIAAVVFLWATKKKVQAVLEDELDYKVAGDASRYAIIIYATLATILGIYFMARRAENPAYELLGSALCYSTCFLMILQSLLFKFLRKKNYGHTQDAN